MQALDLLFDSPEWLRRSHTSGRAAGGRENRQAENGATVQPVAGAKRQRRAATEVPAAVSAAVAAATPAGREELRQAAEPQAS